MNTENLLELREKSKPLAPEMRLWGWDRNADLILKVFNTKLHIEQEETHHLMNKSKNENQCAEDMWYVSILIFWDFFQKFLNVWMTYLYTALIYSQFHQGKTDFEGIRSISVGPRCTQWSVPTQTSVCESATAGPITIVMSVGWGMCPPSATEILGW